MTYSINRRLWIGLAATWLISFSSVASGQVAFFDGITSDFNDGNNWSGLAVPGQFDLAVHNGAGINTQVLDITANANVDSFRISGSFAAPVINHTAGILTIEDTTSTADAFPDNGFWVGEFGPSVSTYNLSGGTIEIDDALDAFQVGRGSNQTGNFNFTAGTINVNNGGETVIGLDGNANWTQSAGAFNANAVHLGRFVSPTTTVNLSGTADWNLSGALLLADESTSLGPVSASTTLNITGSNVGLDVNGLFLRQNAVVNFIPDASGVSPIVQAGAAGFELVDIDPGGNNPQLTIDNASGYFTNVATPDEVVLINAVNNPIGIFRNLPEGTVVPNTDGRMITYRGGSDGFDVALVRETPALADGVISRWSMASNAGSFPDGNPRVVDSRTAAGEGSLRADGAFSAADDPLNFLTANLGTTLPTSTDVPPTSMFDNGNDAGGSSYNSAALAADSGDGALFFAQDIYGDEFSFTDSFSVEGFFKTGSDDVQQILLQGESFARWGVTINEGVSGDPAVPTSGGIRFFVNDGDDVAGYGVETIDLGVGTNDFSNNTWHYFLATFEEGAGADQLGQLTLTVVDESGSATSAVRDLTGGVLPFDLPEGIDDNLLVGADTFLGSGTRRFQGLLDEIQITRGLVSATDRLGLIPAGGIAGDFNGDGMVDGADYAFWRNNLGTGVEPAGTGDGSGILDAADLPFWIGNFGDSAGPGAIVSSVPEPSGMLLLATIGLLGARRRSRSR